MNDFATKNYHSGNNTLKAKVKNFLFVAAVIVAGVSALAVTSEVGHALQMQRIAAASVK
jgi:hypothetical protein